MLDGCPADTGEGDLWTALALHNMVPNAQTCRRNQGTCSWLLFKTLYDHSRRGQNSQILSDLEGHIHCFAHKCHLVAGGETVLLLEANHLVYTDS